MNRLKELLKGHLENHQQMLEGIDYESDDALERVRVACTLTMTGIEMVNAETMIEIAGQLERIADGLEALA